MISIPWTPPTVSKAPERKSLQRSLALLILSTLILPFSVSAQSTFGSIIGTLKDPSSGVIVGASVVLTNKGTGSKHNTVSGPNGSFSFLNLDAGTYSLTIEATGFQFSEFSSLDLQARETKRVDTTLQIGAATETVQVQDTSAGVINTDESSLSSTKTGRELVDLPIAIQSRSTGSTSPISTLTTEPGVQTDDNGNLVIAGTTPALMSVTIDGISSVNVESSGPINELFPSFNSISEIRVSSTNNNAEYSGVADITTTSKSGTNIYHGGIFENLENTALTAGNPFSTTKTVIHMNDFGGFVGGPTRVPKIYNGHDKSFFFFSYEGLRLPRQTFLPGVPVPSLDMRGLGTKSTNGNAYLTDYLASKNISAIYGPQGKDPNNPNDPGLDQTSVPISQLAANVMKYLMPLPNSGTYLYSGNIATPISANQWDLRVDQTITPKQTIYARYSWKNRSVVQAPSLGCQGSFCSTAGSPSTGAYSLPEQDRGLTVAYNYTITPSLMNEFRAGYNTLRSSTSLSVDPNALVSELGIGGLPAAPTGIEVPNFQISGFQATGGSNSTHQQSKVIQALDNLTWLHHSHTFKFGADVRRLTDHDENVFGSQVLGQYVFNASSSVVGQNIGDPYTEFIDGYPDYTSLAQVKDPAMNGLGYAYAAYAQDDWKVSRNLTLNIGFRYELHPPLKDTHYNTAAFFPDYNQDGVKGAVVVPNTKALALTEPSFAASISPTPILTAAQAHVPEALRYTVKTDFGPRIGFAYRPFGNDKTVIRGGWGRFIESPLGFSLVSGWAVSASSVNIYTNALGSDGKTPTLSFPAPFPTDLNAASAGGISFYYAFPFHYHDPTVQQWNLTVERDLGYGIGARISYVGSHGRDLENFEDLNQVPSNSTGYDASNKPFPLWGVLQSVANIGVSNYNSLNVVVDKRFSRGFQIQSSYVFTKDLSDSGGSVPTQFAGAGGNYVTDKFHPLLDYGNVIYDRKHRFLTTYLYNLPLGRGGMLLRNSNWLVDRLVGGWQLGGVLVFQSGAFLTPSESSTDPAGTNVLNFVGTTHVDRNPGVPLKYNARNSNCTAPVGAKPFLCSNAFTIPGQDIGRFGNVGVGTVVGPGTNTVSMALIKSVKFTEQAQFQFGAEAANVFNHRNYETPAMAIDQGNFGSISNLQTAEGAGPRNLEITARLSF